MPAYRYTITIVEEEEPPRVEEPAPAEEPRRRRGLWGWVVALLALALLGEAIEPSGAEASAEPRVRGGRY
jgi:hypothetical protein